MLDTDDPTEINIALDFLRGHPKSVERMRADAQETAESFSWKNVVEDNLLGKLRYVALRQTGRRRPARAAGQPRRPRAGRRPRPRREPAEAKAAKPGPRRRFAPALRRPTSA